MDLPARPALALSLAALLAACGGGGVVTQPGEPQGEELGDHDHGGHDHADPSTPGVTLPPTTGEENPPPPPEPTPGGGAKLAIAAQDSLSSRLNESKEIAVALQPANGYGGSVALSVEGLPVGVTATFSPAVAAVSGPTQVTLKLSVASDAIAGTQPLIIRAKDGEVEASAPVSLTIPAELVLFIKAGVQTTNNLAAFGAESFNVRLVEPGTRVTFENQDAIRHQIHANGTLGLSHEGSPMQPGGSYSDVLTGAGTVEFRCHIHSGMKGRIVVQ